MIKTFFFKLIYLILACTILTISDAHSQISKDSPKIIEKAKIDSLIDAREFEKGIVLLKKAISNAQETDYKNLAILYNKLALCQLNTDKLNLGKENAEKALELCSLEVQGVSEEEAKGYFNLGVYYDLNSDLQQAETILKKSLALYTGKKIQDNHAKGKVHLRLAQVFEKSRDSKFAMAHLDSAYAFLKKVKPIDFGSMGNYHFIAGNLSPDGEFDKEEENYSNAIAMLSQVQNPNWKTIATAHSKLASTYLNAWKDEKALQHLANSQEIQLREFGENYAGNGLNYQMFSVIYNSQGEYEKSSEYSKRAINLYKNTYGEDHMRVGVSYNILADTYFKMRKYEQALQIHKKALIVLQKTLDEKHLYIFASYNYLGRTQYYLGNHQESLSYLEKALKIGIDMYGEHHSRLITIYRLLGNTLDIMGKPEEAKIKFQNALSIARKIYGEKSKTTNGIYNAMANFYVENQQIDEAIIYYDKVLTLYHKEIKEFLDTDDRNLEFNILPGILTAFKGRGRSLFRKYKEYGDTKDLVASNATFQQSGLFLEKMRRNIIEPSSRIELTANNQAGLLGLVETFVELDKHDKDQNYLAKAFLGSERNKASTLQDLIYRSSIIELDNDLKETRKFEANLKRQKATILSKLKTKKNNPDKDSTRLEAYENELFQIRKKNDSLLTEIQKNHPKYYDIEYTDLSITIQDVQRMLDVNTTLVEYFEGRNALYAFIISKNTFGVSELSATDLTQNIEEFRTAVRSKDIASFKEKARDLYHVLVEPFEKQLIGNKLILVPDGPIWYLNFDLLLTAQSASKNPKDLPYLLKDFAMSYSNSASYLYGFPGQKAEPQNDCLAFSFSDSLNINVAESISLNTLRNSKKDLPGSRMEISEIAKIVGGDYYYGSNASEANFKRMPATMAFYIWPYMER